MKALKEIFIIGNYDKEERELFFNQYFQEFKNHNGVANLMKLQTSNAPKVSEYADALLDKYR